VEEDMIPQPLNVNEIIGSRGYAGELVEDDPHPPPLGTKEVIQANRAAWAEPHVTRALLAYGFSIGYGLIIATVLVVIIVVGGDTTGNLQWMIREILPPFLTLVGLAVGWYFGSQGREYRS
jgi:hypothetical protein